MAVREIPGLFGASTLFLTVLGGGVGFKLGKFLPAYYRGIFRGGQDPDFDPVAMGIGQGLTQGLTAGAAVGVLLVMVLAWYRAKTFTNKAASA